MKKVKNFDEGFKNEYGAFYFENNSYSKNECMRFAVEMANLSSYDDKKETFLNKDVPQPKIAAVLVTKDYVYCAARSGIKYGDHAEFTILNSMLNNKTISEDDILYTTLEPCTPESRSQWTESCSTLIINKKVKNVCIGTFDANPLVFGVGINMLLENNINVSFFDKEYVQSLKDLNKEFFEFCRKYPDIKILKRIDKFLYDKIDVEALKVYYHEDVSNETYVKFYREMLDSEQIKEGKVHGTLTISKEMALAFMKNPSYFLPGYNTGIINKNNNTDDFAKGKRKILDKSLLTICNIEKKNNIFEIILKSLGLLDNQEYDVKTLNKILQKQFGNILQLREFIINAFVHNNYENNIGVTIELLNSNHIKIINIISKDANVEETKNSFNDGTLYSVPVNPVLMKYFVQARLAENTGLGFDNKHKTIFDVKKQLSNKILITEIKK